MKHQMAEHSPGVWSLWAQDFQGLHFWDAGCSVCVHVYLMNTQFCFVLFFITGHWATMVTG